MTDETFSLAALVLCPTSDRSGIAETLLSLAAQTHPDFEVHVIVADGDASGAREVRELVGTFDEEFSTRVNVVAGAPGGAGTPLGSGVAQARASYVAVLYPDDVVFAHWAETFAFHGRHAGGRALSSPVASQVVEAATTGEGGRFVTTVERPEVTGALAFDLVEHVASAPLHLRGLALPRRAVQQVLAQRIPPSAEGWAVRLAVGLSCGTVDTGEVTYLRRRERAAGRGSFDEVQWAGDRRTALAALGRCGLAIGADFLASLEPATDHPRVDSQAEVDLLRAQLRQAEEAGRTHAEAERQARDRMAELLSSTSWRASAPLRALGHVARRRTRRPRTR
jgi:hypothetical protein